jgi:hypothetical protein
MREPALTLINGRALSCLVVARSRPPPPPTRARPRPPSGGGARAGFAAMAILAGTARPLGPALATRLGGECARAGWKRTSAAWPEIGILLMDTPDRSRVAPMIPGYITSRNAPMLGDCRRPMRATTCRTKGSMVLHKAKSSLGFLESGDTLIWTSPEIAHYFP